MWKQDPDKQSWRKAGRHPVSASRQAGRLASSIILLAGLSLSLAFSVPARGQKLATPRLPVKTFMKKNTFYLPIKIDQRVRKSLKEVRLYSKREPTQSWKLEQTVDASKDFFTFKATDDGEYWFTVVTVSKLGRTTPKEVDKEGPGLIVVVDTKSPQVRVKQVPHPGDSPCLHCEVVDANTDSTKTRFLYQRGDKNWESLESMPGRSDHFLIPREAVYTGNVRVSAADLAGNAIEEEINIGMTTVANKAPEAVKPAPEPEVREKKEPSLLAKNIRKQESPKDDQDGPSMPPPPEPIMPTIHKKVLTQEDDVENRLNRGKPARVVQQKAEMVDDKMPVVANKQFVSKHHLYLQYKIEDKGASGVGKVEVWMTRDHGRSWQRVGEDADRHSPAEVIMPGEGHYGISLVVSNGRGFGAKPPSTGDNADVWVEVDTTKPMAEILAVRPGTGAEAGTLLINWNARDRNLAPGSIGLAYAVKPEGPWQQIAENLDNTGQFRWIVPLEVGPNAYIRIRVRDLAGNVTETETAEPIALDDMSRPRARIMGVTTTEPSSN